MATSSRPAADEAGWSSSTNCSTPAAVGFEEVAVRKLPLRILVQILHVRVRRRAVDVKVVLLDVLAMIALAVGEAEQALFEDRIPLVPESHREAQSLFVVRDAGQTVLAPPVGSRTRLVVGEVVPGIPVGAVVLAYGSPLPLAQIRPPFFPRDALLASLVEAFLFRDIDDWCIRHTCVPSHPLDGLRVARIGLRGPNAAVLITQRWFPLRAHGRAVFRVFSDGPDR